MKNGIYIYSESKTGFVGVEKKINDQIKVFSEFFEIKRIVIKKEAKACSALFSRLPFGSMSMDYSQALEEIKLHTEECGLPAFFYIRNRPIDISYIGFLREIKRRYPGVKILLEIPTFPYEREYLQSRTMWPWFIKDRTYRKNLKNYIDRVVTYSDDRNIYGIPTIRTKNGIIIEEKEDSLVNSRQYNDTINLLAVGQFQPSHGYERLIEGLRDYSEKNSPHKVILHMVGEGKENNRYKNLVKSYHLSDNVIFHGQKRGAELRKICECCDIGMGCFGAYKRRIKKSSALKTREYLSSGIPVVSGAPEDAFEGTQSDFYLEFPNDNSVVNIERIVEFYCELQSKYSRAELSSAIREFAKNTVDMKTTLLPVFEYLNEVE